MIIAFVQKGVGYVSHREGAGCPGNGVSQGSRSRGRAGRVRPGLLLRFDNCKLVGS